MVVKKIEDIGSINVINYWGSIESVLHEDDISIKGFTSVNYLEDQNEGQNIL